MTETPATVEHGPKVERAIANLNRAAEGLVRHQPNDARWEHFDRRVAELISAVKAEQPNNR